MDRWLIAPLLALTLLIGGSSWQAASAGTGKPVAGQNKAGKKKGKKKGKKGKKKKGKKGKKGVKKPARAA
jgi:hypothetical protein